VARRRAAEHGADRARGGQAARGRGRRSTRPTSPTSGPCSTRASFRTGPTSWAGRRMRERKRRWPDRVRLLP
jgi:hypothetical protein